MKVILEKSFILHVSRACPDFLDRLVNLGFEINMPRELIQDLKDHLLLNSTSKGEKEEVRNVLEYFEKNSVNKLTLGKESLIDWYIRQGNEGYYLASMDSRINNSVSLLVKFHKDCNFEMVDKEDPEKTFSEPILDKRPPLEGKRPFSRGGRAHKGVVGKGNESRKLRFGKP